MFLKSQKSIFDFLYQRVPLAFRRSLQMGRDRRSAASPLFPLNRNSSSVYYRAERAMQIFITWLPGLSWNTLLVLATTSSILSPAEAAMRGTARQQSNSVVRVSLI